MKIRGSQNSSWNDCSRRGASKAYREMIEEAGYIMNEDAYMVRFVASSLGTSVHSGVEYACKAKMNGEEVDLKEMTDIALAQFEEYENNGLAYDNLTPKPSDGKMQIESICRAYFYFILDKVLPISVEELLQAEMADGTIVSMHADIIEQSAVRDLKTGKDPFSYHGQLGTYSLIAKANKICTPTALIVDWLPRISVSKQYEEPRSYVFNPEVCEAEARSTMKSIISQVNEFKETQNPNSFPANTMSNLCSRKFCPAHGTDFCKLKEAD